MLLFFLSSMPSLKLVLLEMRSLFHKTYPTLQSSQVSSSKILQSSVASECVIIITTGFTDHLLCVRPLAAVLSPPPNNIREADVSTDIRGRELPAEVEAGQQVFPGRQPQTAQ